MQNSTNIRILELLRFLYERTDENHPATVSDIIAHLNGKGIQAVRQTVYADTNALIDAGTVSYTHLDVYKRQELAIALPADWKLDQESMKNEKWYWPIRLLKVLARLPIASEMCIRDRFGASAGR